MSLVEVVVHCALLTLFVLMVFGSIPRGETRSMRELQQASMEANQALTEISQDLANSRAKVVRFEGPPAVAMPAAQKDRREAFSYTDSGEILWYGWVVYALEGDRLYRYFQPLPAPTLSSSLGAAPQPTSLQSNATREVVARNLTGFEVKPIELGLWEVSLTVKVGDSQARLSHRGRPRN